MKKTTATAERVRVLALRLVVLAALATVTLFSGSALAATGGLRYAEDMIPRFNITKMAQPPEIDGTIDPAEWKTAAKVMGMVSTGGLEYKDRPASFWLAWDEQNIYLAYRVDILTEPVPYLKRSFRDKFATGIVYDDTFEFGLFLHDRNKPEDQASSFYQCIINYLGNGEYTKSYPSIGQNIKNWLPDFDIKSRIATDAAGKSWWEMEIAMDLEDLEMPRPHRAGDPVDIGLFADVKNPNWQWLDYPSASGHLEHYGFPRAVLTENEPYIQIEEVSGLHDEKLDLKSVIYNPSGKSAKVDAALLLQHGARIASHAGELTEPTIVLDKKQTLDIPAGGSMRFDVSAAFPGLPSAANGRGFLRLTAKSADAAAERPLYSFACNFWGTDKSYLTPAKHEPHLATKIRFNPVNGRLWLAVDTLDAPIPEGAEIAGATYNGTMTWLNSARCNLENMQLGWLS